MKKFTITGAAENGLPLFMHAVANDVTQLEAFIRNSVLGDSGTFILEGHCISADGRKPDVLDAVAGTIEWAHPTVSISYQR